MESARNLGMQEIFAKFNSGQLRTTTGEYIVRPNNTFWNSDSPSPTSSNTNVNGSPTNSTAGPANASTNVSTPVPDGQNTKIGNTSNSTTVINPDPNSTDVNVTFDQSLQTRVANAQATNGSISGYPTTPTGQQTPIV